ncbi:MAG: S-methyl-5'-thioadenosine phosphorylase, partial [Chloroflexota bacterium]|nr:S-methyl-5'-thioadenosine phosphorylase [Chloroflexota bacterium]
MMSGTNRQIDLAFIGGSGLYALDELKDEEFVSVDTPFGSTSDDIALGTLGDIEVGFLPRHGRGHHLLPSEVPYAANIYALKTLGTKVI